MTIPSWNKTPTSFDLQSTSRGTIVQRINVIRLFESIACLALLALGDLRAEGTPPPNNYSEQLPLQNELARKASWSQPTERENAGRLEKWLSGQPETNQEKATLARTVPREDLDTLDYLMRVICTVETQHQKLLTDTSSMFPVEIMRLAEKLTQGEQNTFATETIRLWTARKLIRLARYDEAAILLKNLPIDSSVDPTTLLFCKAACEYCPDIEEAAKASPSYLKESKNCCRYRQLALLEADITSIKEDSLDHISRRMGTSRERTWTAGPGVQAVQNGVIDSLDKLIKLEEQKQQQTSGAGSAGGSMSDGRPMEDSQLAGGKGRGEVKQREFGDTEDWGNLPPREREDALQQIGRDYPAHYREAIEQYFKRLATGKQ